MGGLSRKSWFWWMVLVFAGTGLVAIIYSSIVADADNNSQTAIFLRDLIEGTMLQTIMAEIGVFARNEGVSAIMIGGLTSLIPLSFIYLFRIPTIRRMAIQIITAGYYENFLAGVIQNIYASGGDVEKSVIIILPSFELVTNKTVYWGKYKAVLARHGFELVQETTDDDFGRNIFLIQKLDNPPLPVFIDMPTTLTNLKKIIELEDNSPAGDVPDRRWHKKRFMELRNQFQEELETYVAQDDWGNVRFVEGNSMPAFEKELTDILASY